MRMKILKRLNINWLNVIPTRYAKKILTLTDLAELASDALTGTYDIIQGERIKIKGYLEEFALSKAEADNLVMSAGDKVYKACKMGKGENEIKDINIWTLKNKIKHNFLELISILLNPNSFLISAGLL